MEQACMICPRKCGALRENGRTGFCGETDEIKLARAALHYWEEPVISGTEGSGTVFFSGCNLRCIYCQNRDIALGKTGKAVTPDRLYDIFFELKEKGANNINLVTPSHYVPQIVPIIERARRDGISIPFVYNSSAYESVETLKMLDGLIDIYLPDFKYISSQTAKNYSYAANYPLVAKLAIAEMIRQCGEPVFENDLMKKGTIVRHLVLPGHVGESQKIVRYLYETYGDSIFISILNQYTPVLDEEYRNNFPELFRTLSQAEYDAVVDYAVGIGIENGFIQEGETCKESFIPAFDYEGV